MMQKKPTPEEIFDHLLSLTTRETEISKEYAAAPDFEAFTYLAAEKICIAAVFIMTSLKSHKCGSLILLAMKKIRPTAYRRYRDKDIKLYAYSALFVVSRLRESMQRWHQDLYVPDSYYDQLAIWSSIVYYDLTKLPQDEIPDFQEQTARIMSQHNYNEIDQVNAQLQRIVAASGPDTTPQELLELIKHATLNDPLQFIDPLSFAKNYERLC